MLLFFQNWDTQPNSPRADAPPTTTTTTQPQDADRATRKTAAAFCAARLQLRPSKSRVSCSVSCSATAYWRHKRTFRSTLCSSVNQLAVLLALRARARVQVGTCAVCVLRVRPRRALRGSCARCGGGAAAATATAHLGANQAALGRVTGQSSAHRPRPSAYASPVPPPPPPPLSLEP